MKYGKYANTSKSKKVKSIRKSKRVRRSKKLKKYRKTKGLFKQRFNLLKGGEDESQDLTFYNINDNSKKYKIKILKDITTDLLGEIKNEWIEQIGVPGSKKEEDVVNYYDYYIAKITQDSSINSNNQRNNLKSGDNIYVAKRQGMSTYYYICKEGDLHYTSFSV